MSGGGSLGLGASKQYSASQSASDTYGYSGATSSGTSASQSNQQIAYGDLYQQLFGNAVDTGNSTLARAPEITSAARTLFNGGGSFLDTLGHDAGTNYLTDRVNGPDDVLEQQLGVLRDQSSHLFSDQLNPQITSDAVAGGVLGGGRQGVAQGVAMGEAGRNFTQGATSLIAANQDSKDRAAAQVMQGSVNAANTGLGALPGLLEVLMQGDNAELGTLGKVSSILGGPTTLTSSQSFADQLANSFGETTSSSSSGSHARGRSWNFDSAFSMGG
jgi:hypothetical protein